MGCTKGDRVMIFLSGLLVGGMIGMVITLWILWLLTDEKL